jgi:hypothetical protein
MKVSDELVNRALKSVPLIREASLLNLVLVSEFNFGRPVPASLNFIDTDMFSCLSPPPWPSFSLVITFYIDTTQFRFLLAVPVYVSCSLQIATVNLECGSSSVTDGQYPKQAHLPRLTVADRKPYSGHFSVVASQVWDQHNQGLTDSPLPPLYQKTEIESSLRNVAILSLLSFTRRTRSKNNFTQFTVFVNSVVKETFPSKSDDTPGG